MKYVSSGNGGAVQGVFHAMTTALGDPRRAGLAALCLSLAIVGGVWLIEARGASATPGRAQAPAGNSPTYTFTTIDAVGAGKSALQGTLAISNNAGGDTAGLYLDKSYAAHGFVRTAATGTISNFDAPSAGTSKTQGTFPTRIENGGNITGMYADSSNAYHGFLRAVDGTITEFDVTGAPTTIGHRGTIPLSINPSLEITGFYVDANAVRHGFLRAADGTFTTFDFPNAGTGPTQGTMPVKINAAGGAAGFYVDGNQTFHGFLRNARGGFSIPVDDPNAGTVMTGKGIKFTGTVVHSIDGFGDLAGIYTDSNFAFHGFMLVIATGTFVSIDVPGASTAGLFGGTLLTNMDVDGDITGAYSDANGVEHGFAIAGGTTTINAPLDASEAGTTGLYAGTVPFSINATGELAGTYADASGIFHGFMAIASAVAAPSFSPAPGTYSSAQSVAISDTTPNSLIFYTTDGTPPSTSATAVQYTGPIQVSSTETIEAIAVASGFANSSVTTAVYTITAAAPPAATPMFSPAAGTYTSVQTVAISDATAGATIYYTTNNTAPTTASTVYNAPIAVNSTETIQAMAAAPGFSNSAVASATYTLNLPTPDFKVVVSPTTLTIAAGQSGTATFTVTPVNGFNSQVSFACTGLPAEAACTFNPSSVTPNGIAAASSTLTVTTTAKSAELRPPAELSQRPIYAILLPVLAVLFGFSARKGRSRRGLRLLGVLIFLAAVSGLTSCNSANPVGNPGTPIGTSNVSVSAATSGAGGTNHAATLTITITQ
jgi:chitobiase/beta-hexosaminidase-like protein